MRTIQSITLIAATITTGLVAGLLGAFACAVMPALRGTDDRTFVDVMQRINVAIINPAFMTAFVGGLAFTIAATVAHVGEDERSVLPWIIAGVILYVVVLVITGVVNVPLNDELTAAGDPGRDRRPRRRPSQLRRPVGRVEHREDGRQCRRVSVASPTP